MAHAYDSYLLRCWHLKNGSTRIAVEHVQSGERAVVANLQAATAWIGARPGGDTAPESEECPPRVTHRADRDAARPTEALVGPPQSPTRPRMRSTQDDP
jgi:hypothetical protein